MTVGCIVKTFIIYDMCKGEQIGIFAKSEEFRRIVHKEAIFLIESPFISLPRQCHQEMRVQGMLSNGDRKNQSGNKQKSEQYSICQVAPTSV